jgi:hypothetical protein
LQDDAKLCLTGSNKNGCTLFPSSGFAVLRANAHDPAANNITLVFGPHHAGHQHADLLHFVWQVDGATALLDTAHFGYDDTRHGTWDCQTAAHNTVLVDGVSHLPQGDSDYIWMTHPGGDVPRGHLLAFEAGEKVKVVTAQTSNACGSSITLRRTLLVTEAYVLDDFECEAAEEHRFDYALHPHAPVECALQFHPAKGRRSKPGLGSVENLRAAPVAATGVPLTWGNCAAWLWCSGPAQMALGEAPSPTNSPGAALFLTQQGSLCRFRSVFTRSATSLQSQCRDSAVLINGEGFADVVTFGASGLTWSRQGTEAANATINWEPTR